MMTVQRTFPDLVSAERAVVRLRAIGVPLTEISLIGPDDHEYEAALERYVKQVQPGSYLVKAHVSSPEGAELLKGVFDNESLTQAELERLRSEGPPVEPVSESWHPVEVESTPYGVQPEYHPPVDEGGSLEEEE